MSETPSRDQPRDNAMSVAAISSQRIESDENAWTRRLVFFLRIMAVVSVAKATPWGAVVWLTTVVSMAVIELMFPGIYGGSLTVVGLEALMLAAYLALAWMAARERPP